MREVIKNINRQKPLPELTQKQKTAYGDFPPDYSRAPHLTGRGPDQPVESRWPSHGKDGVVVVVVAVVVRAAAVVAAAVVVVVVVVVAVVVDVVLVLRFHAVS